MRYICLECSLISYQLPSDSLFREPINQIIQTLQEAGLFAIRYEWSLDMLSALFPVRAEERTPSRTLTLNDLSSLIHLYLIGMVLSGVVFIAELVRSRYGKY